MSLQTTTHINFDGDARDALAFYASVFGGQTAVVTYADMGDVQHPDDAAKVVWGQVEAASGVRVMAYDVPTGQPFDRGIASFFVSARGDDETELTAAWEALSDGAQVLFPLGAAPWGAPLYGMLTDRFGVTWVLDIAVAWEG
jgi:PhnB protein